MNESTLLHPVDQADPGDGWLPEVHVLLRLTGLGHSDAAFIYDLYALSRAYNSGCFSIGEAAHAERLGCSVRTVGRRVAKLRRLGLLGVAQDKKGSGQNTYDLSPLLAEYRKHRTEVAHAAVR